MPKKIIGTHEGDWIWKRKLKITQKVEDIMNIYYKPGTREFLTKAADKALKNALIKHRKR